MVDSAVVLAALSGNCIILEVQNRHVYVAIAEEIPVSIGTFQFGYLAQSKHVFIKASGPVNVLGGNGDVLNLRHLATSPAVMLCSDSSSKDTTFA